MKIKEYDTNELLMIANNVTGEYTDKKVRQAKAGTVPARCR